MSEKPPFVYSHLPPEMVEKVVRARTHLISEEQIERIERNTAGKPYDREITEGHFPDSQAWAPAPDREVASAWEPMPSHINLPTDKAEQAAEIARLKAHGFTGGRVRLLQDQLIAGEDLSRGSVVDLGPLDYFRMLPRHRSLRPLAEPVSTKVPVKKLRRVAMPSSLAKARRIAAQELRKDEGELSISDIWKFFATRKPSAAVILNEIPQPK